MRLKYLPLFLLAIFQLQGYSQTKWSLEDCINHAHANNLQIKRTELQSEIADNNFLQSKLNIAPDLNAGATRTYNFGRQIDPYRNEFIQSNTLNDNFGVSANLNLFNGLQTFNSIKKNEYIMLASIQNIEKEKIEITLDIASAYLNILFAEELLQINNNQVEVTELQVDRTSRLVDAGSVAKGDLLEIKAQWASERLNITNAQNNLNLAYLNLTQLLDLDSVSGFEIVFPDTVDPDLTKTIATASEVYNDALTYLPHIKGAEYELKSYERDLAVQKGKRSPQLYVKGSWGTGFSSYGRDSLGISYASQFNGNSNSTILLGISIPIFNNWQVNTSISNAKVRFYDAEYSFDQVKQRLYKNIQQSYNDAISAGEKYKSAIEAVNSYSESFQYTEKKFTVGIVNSVEYNIAKNNFIRAESDLLQAKYEYIFAVKILDFYKGMPITL